MPGGLTGPKGSSTGPNPLLIRAEVGKSRTLLPQSFRSTTFGISNPPHGDGVRKSLVWTTTNPQTSADSSNGVDNHGSSASSIPVTIDHITLNRRIVSTGSEIPIRSTPKDTMNAIRGSADRYDQIVERTLTTNTRSSTCGLNRSQSRSQSRNQNSGVPAALEDPDFCFGRRVRPSTPVSRVLQVPDDGGDRARNEWILSASKKRSHSNTMARSIVHTKSSIGHSGPKSGPPTLKPVDELYKMREFQTVGARVDTHW